MMQREWLLFLDETGQKDDTDDHFAIAGVLLPLPDDPRWDLLLKSRLLTALPMIPWPFHAVLTRVPVMYALWHHVRRQHGSLATLEASGPAALDAMQARWPEEVEYLLDVLRTRGEPRGDDFRRVTALDRDFRRQCPGHYQPLRDVARDARAIIERLLVEGLVVEGQGDGDGKPDGRTIVVSARPRGKAHEPADQDAYLEALRCLYQRVHDGLERLDGTHRVHVHAATLRVVDPTFAKEWKLNRQHLMGVAGSIERGASTKVSLRFGGTYDFDAWAPAGLVAADYIANSLYGVSRNSPLGRLRGWVQARYASAIDCGSPGLPMVCATGRYDEHVAAARSGRPTTLEGVRENWMSEQARIWARYFEQLEVEA